jgi:hypothetical protein
MVKKEMKKKILIVSIFAALLVVSMPFVSTLHAQSAQEESTNTMVVATPTTPIEQLVAQLQYIIDNYLDGFDEDFVQDFQNNVDILSNGPDDSQFCDALWTIGGYLVIIFYYLEETYGTTFALLIVGPAMLTVQGLFIEYCNPDGQSCECGCSATATTTAISAPAGATSGQSSANR